MFEGMVIDGKCLEVALEPQNEKERKPLRSRGVCVFFWHGAEGGVGGEWGKWVENLGVFVLLDVCFFGFSDDSGWVF